MRSKVWPLALRTHTEEAIADIVDAIAFPACPPRVRVTDAG